MPRSKRSASDGGSVRAVVDTNVLISGLFWRGAPHVLLGDARAGRLSLVTSPALLAELAEVIDRPKFQTILSRSGVDAAEMLLERQRLVEVIDPPHRCRRPLAMVPMMMRCCPSPSPLMPT